MATDRDDHPLALDRPDEARRLREALDRAGYEPQRIRELLHVTPSRRPRSSPSAGTRPSSW
jgi:hypothetical protein